LAGVVVLAVALARTENVLNVIGRRDAATTQRSRLENAKTQPRSAAHEDEILSTDLSDGISVFELARTVNGDLFKKNAFLRKKNAEPL